MVPQLGVGRREGGFRRVGVRQVAAFEVYGAFFGGRASSFSRGGVSMAFSSRGTGREGGLSVPLSCFGFGSVRPGSAFLPSRGRASGLSRVVVAAAPREQARDPAWEGASVRPVAEGLGAVTASGTLRPGALKSHRGEGEACRAGLLRALASPGTWMSCDPAVL